MGRAAAGLFALWGIPLYLIVFFFGGYTTLMGFAKLFDNGEYVMASLMLTTIPAGWYATALTPWVRKIDILRAALAPILWTAFAMALSATLNLNL